MTQKIFIGADHRGFTKKQMLIDFIRANFADFELIDLGAYQYHASDNYNDFAIAVANNVTSNPDSFGILLCGSAHGISIQANRKKGIRAIIGFTPKLAKLGREHNNANIICFAADFQSDHEIQNALSVFLATTFQNEDRLIRRNNRLDEEF